MLYILEHGGIVNTNYIGAITEVTVKMFSSYTEYIQYFRYDKEWNNWFSVKRMEEWGFEITENNSLKVNDYGFPIMNPNIHCDNEIMFYAVHMAFPAPAGLSSGHMKLFVSKKDLENILLLDK